MIIVHGGIMDNLFDKIQKFMEDRYGMDQFNLFLAVITFILVDSAIIFGIPFLQIPGYLALIILTYRTFSKQKQKRIIENRRYMELTDPFRKRYILVKKNLTDKQHKYYICPQCRQLVRVPRGKGMVEVTCPKCKAKFSRKS